jgi:predicted house-cleaning noncanonical NTP pyrophosphatase (MazG superfamily)
METATLREKLHSLIDNSPTDKLEEVYHLLNDEEYSDAFKANLDEEYSSYQKDGEVISKEEIDNMIYQLLHGKK